ncbi:MAG: pectin esterase [Lewinellaceae bacterium]|nr:pectin esterase [Lewinellaceae bacterium]
MINRLYYFLFLLVSIPEGYAQSPGYPLIITVAKDGSGDALTIQAAIDQTKAFPDQRITIVIKPGIYEEKVHVPSWNNQLTLQGEDPATTIIRWGDHFSSINRGRNSTFFTATLWVEGDDFRAENLTIENTAGPVGQALALGVVAERAVFVNCRLLGHQDTLYAAGAQARQFFYQCYIEGTTDFIFGEATALFEQCTIHSKANSFITAASTPQGRPFGFVFRYCTLTAAPGVNEVYLGRPWRDFAKTAFLFCDMGPHILPAGWDNWSSPSREKTTVYAEYGNTGPGAAQANRVAWSHQLRKKEARRYLAEQILSPFMLPVMRTP